MATETKIGVGLMLLLVGVFGVLVYTKWDAHRRESLAAAESGSAEAMFEDVAETVADAAGEVSESAAETAAPVVAAVAQFAPEAAEQLDETAARVVAVADDWGFEPDTPAADDEPAFVINDAPTADDFGFAAAPVEVREPAEPAFDDFSSPGPAASEPVDAAPFADDFGFAAAPVETETPEPAPAGFADDFTGEPYMAETEPAAPAEAAPWDDFHVTEPTVAEEFTAPDQFTAEAEPAAPADNWGFATDFSPEPAAQTEPAPADFAAEPVWGDEPAAVADFPEPEPAAEPTAVPADDPWGFDPAPVATAPVSPTAPAETPEPFIPDVDVRTVAAARNGSPSFDPIPDPADIPRTPEIRPRRVGSASGVTLGTPQPVAGPGLVVARRDDSFWTIADRVYGEPKFYLALAKANANRVRPPGRLKPGMKIVTPSVEELRTRFPQLCPRPTGPNGEELGGFFIDDDGRPAYRVRTHETLSHIAMNHLGRASRWVQIFELNRDRIDDVNKLKPQTVLRLPPDASRVRFASAGAR